MTLNQRLAEFCARLMAAPACGSKEEAFALLSQTLVDVEDEHSGIPFNPSYPRNDGRMYPPREDAHRDVPGREDLHRYRSKRHNTFLSNSGAILIVDKDRSVILDKPDTNARSITL